VTGCGCFGDPPAGLGFEAFACRVDPAADLLNANVAVLDGLQKHLQLVCVPGAQRFGGLP